jgi:hypothetical protein
MDLRVRRFPLRELQRIETADAFAHAASKPASNAIETGP